MLPVCAGLQKGSVAGGQQGHATKGQLVDPKTGISLPIKYRWWIQRQRFLYKLNSNNIIY